MTSSSLEAYPWALVDILPLDSFSYCFLYIKKCLVLLLPRFPTKAKLLAVTEQTLWNGELKQLFFLLTLLHSSIWPLWWTGSNKLTMRTLSLHPLMFPVFLKKKKPTIFYWLLFSMEIIPNSGLCSILASHDSEGVKCLKNLWNHSCKHLNIKWRGKKPFIPRFCISDVKALT